MLVERGPFDPELFVFDRRAANNALLQMALNVWSKKLLARRLREELTTSIGSRSLQKRYTHDKRL